MTHLHCFDCNRDVEVFGIYRLGGAVTGHATGCKAIRVTPIAVICDPPEPTVIDESDLAPGMVVVAVDETTSAVAFLCSGDARLGGTGSRFVIAYRQVILSEIASARYIAGKADR